MDSYENFLMYFQIEKKTLFDWGISATIFPPIETVEREWENLKNVFLKINVCISVAMAEMPMELICIKGCMQLFLEIHKFRKTQLIMPSHINL